MVVFECIAGRREWLPTPDPVLRDQPIRSTNTERSRRAMRYRLNRLAMPRDEIRRGRCLLQRRALVLTADAQGQSRSVE